MAAKIPEELYEKIESLSESQAKLLLLMSISSGQTPAWQMESAIAYVRDMREEK